MWAQLVWSLRRITRCHRRRTGYLSRGCGNRCSALNGPVDGEKIIRAIDTRHELPCYCVRKHTVINDFNPRFLCGPLPSTPLRNRTDHCAQTRIHEPMAGVVQALSTRQVVPTGSARSMVAVRIAAVCEAELSPAC